MDMMIEPAAADQWEEAADLWRRTGLTKPYNDPRTDFEFALGKVASDVLVGVIDGKIVATAMAGHDGHRGWVYYLAVEPALQKQGLGAKMMAAVEEWHRRHGVWKINLMVRGANAAVQDFYKAIGYEINDVAVLAKRLA